MFDNAFTYIFSSSFDYGVINKHKKEKMCWFFYEGTPKWSKVKFFEFVTIPKRFLERE